MTVVTKSQEILEVCQKVGLETTQELESIGKSKVTWVDASSLVEWQGLEQIANTDLTSTILYVLIEDFELKASSPQYDEDLLGLRPPQSF